MNSRTVAFLVLGVVAVVYLIFPDIMRILDRTPDDGCGGRPQDALFASERDFELRLEESVAVFRGQSRPAVLDAFPREARSVQMVSYMSCKAAQQGLITNNDELIQYTEALGIFFESGRFPERITHSGTLAELAAFVQEDVGSSWTLRVTDNVKHIFITKTEGATPRSLMSKICSAHECLDCAGIDGSGALASVSISLVDGNETEEYFEDGVKYQRCAGQGQ